MSTDDGLVQLHYIVPLGHAKNFTSYAAINVPDDNMTITALFNNSLVNLIAVDTKNLTFFPILELNVHGIYEATTLLLDSCSRTVFSSPTRIHGSCNTTVAQRYNPGIVQLTADEAVVYSASPHSISLQCTDGIHNLTAAVNIIDTSECTLLNNFTSFSGQHSIEIDTGGSLTPMNNIKWIEPLAPIDAPTEQLTSLQNQLHDIQQEWEQQNWYQHPATHATSATVLLLILVAVTGWCFHQKRRHQQQINPDMELKNVLATAAELFKPTEGKTSWSNLYFIPESTA